MAKLSKAKLDEIIRRDLPGNKLARRPAADAEPKRPPIDAVAPDLPDLRRKYSAAPESERSDRGDEASPDTIVTDDAPEDEIVIYEPDGEQDSWERGAGPKAAVISGSGQRVIGLQG